MSPDDMQRTMQFLLSQQAQFAADFAKLEARFEQLTAKTDKIADGLIGLTGIVGRVAEAQYRTEELVRENARQMKEADDRLAAHIRAVESHIKAVESQLHETFERHLREQHGTRPS